MKGMISSMLDKFSYKFGLRLLTWLIMAQVACFFTAIYLGVCDGKVTCCFLTTLSIQFICYLFVLHLSEK